MSRLQRWSEWIGRWRYPAVPILLGILLAAPSLIVGIQADDLFIRSAIIGSEQFGDISLSSWQPYMYMDGDPVRNHILIDHGWMPWWMDLHCSAALSRPLTALTLMWDYYVWPGYPVLMHVQSLMWYGLLIWAAAILYRRVIGQSLPFWVAVLATVLYAVDDARSRLDARPELLSPLYRLPSLDALGAGPPLAQANLRTQAPAQKDRPPRQARRRSRP